MTVLPPVGSVPARTGRSCILRSMIECCARRHAGVTCPGFSVTLVFQGWKPSSTLVQHPEPHFLICKMGTMTHTWRPSGEESSVEQVMVGLNMVWPETQRKGMKTGSRCGWRSEQRLASMFAPRKAGIPDLPGVGGGGRR